MRDLRFSWRWLEWFSRRNSFGMTTLLAHLSLIVFTKESATRDKNHSIDAYEVSRIVRLCSLLVYYSYSQIFSGHFSFLYTTYFQHMFSERNYGSQWYKTSGEIKNIDSILKMEELYFFEILVPTCQNLRYHDFDGNNISCTLFFFARRIPSKIILERHNNTNKNTGTEKFKY
jgi:hypothetical protein